MSWIIIFALLVIVVIVIIMAKNSKQQTQNTSVDSSERFPYKKLDVLFSPAERSFLGVLSQAVDSNIQVFGKVRVADVITTQEGLSRSEWQIAFNKIAGKHFDFLLCNKDDLSILCAIELDDKSHNSKKRMARDAFLVGACKAAKVPLVQFKAKAAYEINDIRQSLAAFMPSVVSPDNPLEPAEMSEPQPSLNDQRDCPKCSSAMTLRKANKGKNKGDSFLGCSAFPKCRYIESLDDNKEAFFEQ